MTDTDPHPSPGNTQSVLAGLPRTRPQRRSPRRGSSRARASTPTPVGRPTETVSDTAVRSRSKASKTRRIPRQGFEQEIEIGATVEPPTTTEMAGALARLTGEMMRASISGAGHLVRGARSRLPRI